MLSKVGDWLDERTAWRVRAARWANHPAVGGSPWASAIGTAVATCFAVLALTGLVLQTSYAPAPQAAWASVHYIEFVQAGGWLVRGLHYWAAQSLFVLAALHIAHGAFAGTYRAPRELGWFLTLLVLALAVGEGITGGLLPWDQLGWWARVVEGNIVGLAPGLGPWLSQMIAGGSQLGAIGLARAYTLHVMILPPLVALALYGRRWVAGAARPVTSAPPAGGAARARKDGAASTLPSSGGRSGWPAASRAAIGVGVATLVVFALLALAGGAHGAPLDAPADPLSDYPARPEWFLAPMFQLRKLFHGSLEFWGTSIVPGLAAGYLALLPWIDRPGRPRALVLGPVVAIFGGAIALGAVAATRDAHDEHFQKAHAKAKAQAAAAIHLAMNGVPPGGALDMVQHDPELRGRDLFDKHCASCHVLGDLGDASKASATALDGWGTAEWIAAMVRDPDAPVFFGTGPFKGQMPSADTRPKDKAAGEPWTAMVKTDAERQAVAGFLASQGDEPGDPPRVLAEAKRAQGERIVSERCTTCHLYKGQGDDEGSGAAPELAGYGSLAWTRAQIANPSSPRTYRDKALDASLKKHMPRFDTDLSPADVDLVARWTRTHARASRLAAAPPAGR